MMPTPSVSVIMPVYNASKYLGAAVKSVLSQTYADFEFIIIDDASTDDSAELISRFQDPRIVFLQNSSNLRLPGTLNRALSIARGMYVARMDADDIAETDRIAKQVAHLERHPQTDILATWVRIIDAEGSVVEMSRPDPDPSVLAWQLTTWCHICHPTIMYRTETVRRAGGYREHTFPAEDYDLWTRVISAGGRVEALPDYLLRYRNHPGQVSQMQQSEQRRAVCAAAVTYISWLLDQDVSYSQVWALLALYRDFEELTDGDREAAVALGRRVAAECHRRFGATGEDRISDVSADALVYSAAAALARGDRSQARFCLVAAMRWRPLRTFRPRALLLLTRTILPRLCCVL